MSAPADEGLPSPLTETAEASRQPNLFGTFAGVFTPTLLTILGVIMYLRLGWVIGNAGLLGGLLVILVAVGITTATGLALSSIATNTRLDAGGPYAIISKSLGLEVGGSIGVPLFLSQALAVAMYIFGFREGWLWIFPTHPALLVDLIIFVVIFAIAFISAELAFKTQYLVMALIFFSLVLILASPAGWGGGSQLWGSFPGSPESNFEGIHFWGVFAVFFPAATGIMAGANMSGELQNPRRSIPRGTMAAILLSTLIYVLLALWIWGAGSAQDLVSNYTIMIDQSLWAPGVLAGLLGATFSSALTSLVGAPRILTALSKDKIIPRAQWLTKTSRSGEPRNAMLVSGALTLVALLMRDLNLIAPMIAMFFLITYAVINFVVLIESSLRLPSFRPTLKVPRLIPLIGALGCIFAMFIVNPTFSLISVAVVIAIYGWIMILGVRSKTADARSGIFGALAEWAAARATEMQLVGPRMWKPNLMVPVEDTAELRGDFHTLVDLVRPEGTIKLLGLATQATVNDTTVRMETLGHAMRKKKVFTTWSVLDSSSFTQGLIAGMQSLKSAFFRPNLIFLNLHDGPARDDEISGLAKECARLGVGVLLMAEHPKARLGRKAVVHLWLQHATDDTLEAALSSTRQHLAILMALRLQRSWAAQLRILTVVDHASEQDAARSFLNEIVDLARIPGEVELVVEVGTLDACMARPDRQSDLDVMSLSTEPDMKRIRELVDTSRSACLFCGDSGGESALV